MEKKYDFLKQQTKTLEKTSDFLDLKIVSDGKEPFTKAIKRDNEVVDANYVVLLEDSKQMNVKNGSYNLDILGIKMFEYVVKACEETPILVHFDKEKQSVLQAVKPHLRDAEFTVVLFSDTPLITRKNVLNILDFVKNKGLNVCALTRGFVFRTEYLKRVDEIYSPSTYYFEEEDFLIANSFHSLCLASEMLKNRIVDFHSQNGVYFKDPASLYIEANVAIGKGTEIGSFVSLSGDTTIGEDVKIGNYSELKNSKVSSNVEICGATLDGAYVFSGSKIEHGAKLLSQTAIKENCLVQEDTIISNAIVGKDSNIGKNNVINYLSSDEQISIASSCHVMGTQDKPVVMQKGSSIEDMVTIFDGVLIEENQKIEKGETLKIFKGGESDD